MKTEKSKGLRVGIAIILGLFPSVCFGFSEMNRHGYFNCTSCHYSPTGGGILTPYGRSLSSELLSRGSFFFEKLEKEKKDTDAQFLGGSIELPQGERGEVALGGDIRALQLFENGAKEFSGDFIWMQLDLETAMRFQRLRLVGTLGRGEAPKENPGVLDFFLSRRHWVSFLAGPGETPDLVQVRAGRFYPAYGINIPEHTVITRRKLGFDEEGETYNIEAAYLGESFNVFVTGLFGRPDNADVRREKGGILQLSTNFATNMKVGFNSRLAKLDQDPRRAQGLFANLGFSPEWYMQIQLDRIENARWISFERIGHEVTSGLHLQGFREWQSHGDYEGYGGGVQYFPKAHWQFSLMAKAKRRAIQARQFDQVGWILLHYYL